MCVFLDPSAYGSLKSPVEDSKAHNAGRWEGSPRVGFWGFAIAFVRVFMGFITFFEPVQECVP